MTVLTAVSRTLTPLSAAVSRTLTPLSVRPESVVPSRFTTTRTPTPDILIPKTTLIIIPTTTTMLLLCTKQGTQWRTKWCTQQRTRIIITAVSLPEASLILQPNATLTMTLSSIQIIKTKNPKTTTIIIPTATTTVVLILKTTMITLWMVTLLVPLLPLPPIATLIMPLLEEITRIMSVRNLSAIQMELYSVFLNGNRTSHGTHGNYHQHGILTLIMYVPRNNALQALSAIQMEFYYAFWRSYILLLYWRRKRYRDQDSFAN